MNKLTRLIGACIVIAITAASVVWYGENRQDSLVPDGSSASQKGSAGAGGYHVDDVALGGSINMLLAENTDLDISVSVVDLQTGKRYHWGDPASYSAASINKLVTATAFLRLVEAGQASPDGIVGNGTARSQLTDMIVKSDNTAWHNLNQIVTPEGLETFARSVGMNSYQASDNAVTSEDIALLLDQLCSKKLLNNANSELLLSLMKQADMRNYIVAAVPAGASAYHKTGYLADRLHEAAVIQKGNRSYALVIFSKSAGNYSFSRGAALFGAITETTLAAFFANS